MIKKLVSLLLLFALSLSLFSCQMFQSTPDDTTSVSSDEEGTGGNPPSDELLSIIKKSDLEKFKVVYPRDISNTAVESVFKLVDTIKSMCGVELLSTSDLIVAGNEEREEWEYEILVGYTNREEGIAFGKDYRAFDYGYGYQNGKLILYCEDNSFIASVVTAFVMDVMLKHMGSDVFFQNDWATHKTFDYSIDSMTVNGTDIRTYEIIYADSNKLHEKQIAEMLQDFVALKSSYTLNVKSDSEPRATDHAFLIGRTKYATDLTSTALSDFEGCMSSNGADVAIYSDTRTGMFLASKALTSALFEKIDSEKNLAVTIEGSRKLANADNQYSTMTFNVLTAEPNERVGKVVDTILYYMPDTIGLQEANPTWMYHLQSNLSQYYGFVGEGREGGSKGEGCNILYSLERFDLIESGTKWLSDTPDIPSMLDGAHYLRIYTWALLEDKETKIRYLHLNTHLDVGTGEDGTSTRYEEVSMLMNFLQNYNDVPVVLTGDMNSKITSKEMQLLLDRGFSTVLDYQDVANEPTSADTIDWIMLTSCGAMTKHVVDKTQFGAGFASDHFASYAEFTLTLPEDGKIDHGWDEELSDYPDEWLGVCGDKDGAFYGPPKQLTAFDLGTSGYFDIPDSDSTVTIDGKTYMVIRTTDELTDALAADTGHTNNYILDADLDYFDYDNNKTAKFTTILLGNGQIFDGNGHSMTGFYVQAATDNTSSNQIDYKSGCVFARIKYGTTYTIRNLTIGSFDNKIEITDCQDNSGALAGYVGDGGQLLFENVTVYANFSAVDSANVSIGGFAGSVKSDITINNCKFYGSITGGSGPRGGIIGSVASAAKVELENCMNYGSISGKSNTGGIIGQLQSSNEECVIRNCVNYGSVSTSSSGGGLVGAFNGGGGTLRVENCLNAATIQGNNTAGLMGWVSSGSTTLENTSNIGTVIANNAGGLISTLKATAVIENCGSFASVTTKKTDGTGTQSAIVAVKTVTPTITNVMRTAVASDSCMVDDVEGQVKTVDMAGAVAWLNAHYADVFGSFVLDSKGNGLVFAAPVLAAIQQSADAENIDDIRLVGSIIGNSQRYHAVGFEITMEGEATITKETNKVHRKLCFGEEKVDADAFGGTFVYAVVVEDLIPAEGTVIFTVTAFAADLDGETVYRSTTHSITFTDGNLVAFG